MSNACLPCLPGGYNVLLVPVLLTINQSLIRCQKTGGETYCLDETFQASCSHGEVIRILYAQYGRMETGKCVNTDSGLGCSADVTAVLHGLCSGRVTCGVPVIARALYAANPCHDRTPYLHVAYDCLQAVMLEDCGNVLGSYGSEGYLSSAIAQGSGCGSETRPWYLDVSTGQRVRIELITFRNESLAKLPGTCKSLGHIIEGDLGSNTNLCDGPGGRSYVSTGRPIHIDIDTTTHGESTPAFLLHYRVFGCADVEVGPGKWYRREGEAATVGCEGQDVTWTMACVGNEWQGAVGNCSGGRATRQDGSSAYSKDIDLRRAGVLCVGISFFVAFAVASAVIAWKLRYGHPIPSPDAPPSPPPSPPSPPRLTLVKEPRVWRGPLPPLPPIPLHAPQYRTLLPPPRSEHRVIGHDGLRTTRLSQTLPRPPRLLQSHNDSARHSYEWVDDYTEDWRFGTAPWKKPASP